MRKYLFLLTGLTLCFIWGNSLLPASESSALSLWVTERLSFLSGSIVSGSGNHLVRKITHGTEFLILGLELGFLLDRPWYYSLLLGLAAAFVDETIQLFSPGRAGMIADMWIDLGGSFVGTVISKIILYTKTSHIE